MNTAILKSSLEALRNVHLFVRASEAQKEKCQQEESRSLLNQLADLDRRYKDAENLFNHADSAELVESAIYQMESISAQYRFIYEQIRARRFTQSYSFVSSRQVGMD